ncbi:hypothetical protein E2C01_071724 [Portunus trituberculatus]|uniref:Uncharacterized protein n=1 Tax=Portunus trituberculatus TaxID=210409 RepID=A0A5B7I4P0_PORTR|nr:hypothetical protein [Portunus trituberculatus]
MRYSFVRHRAVRLTPLQGLQYFAVTACKYSEQPLITKQTNVLALNICSGSKCRRWQRHNPLT